MRFKNNNLYIYLIIFLLGLSPLFWFQPGQIINGGDINLAINPADFTYRLLHTWDNRDFAGYDGSQYTSLLFPLSLFFTAFQYLGLSLIAIEKIYFVLVFMLSGFSMYYLVYSLTKSRIASFIAAIFLMFNIPRVDRWAVGDFNLILMYGVLPLTLAFFIKGLNAEKVKIKYSILIAFTTLFLCNWNPATTLAILFIFAIYFLFHTGATKFKLLATNSKFILLTILVVVLFNSWWLYPMTNYLGSGGTAAEISRSVSGDLSWLRIASRNCSILRLFRLTGEWWWDMSGGQTSYPVSYLLNPWLIIITYAIPLVVFSALLFKPKDRNVLFFSISAMFYIILAAGTNPPAGGLYKCFFKNVPGFWLFRSPYQRFSLMIALCYGFLMGIVGREIYNYFKRKRWSSFRILRLEKLSLGIILAIVLISAWPLFTSPLLHGKGQILSGKYSISIPIYYNEAKDWLERAKRDDSKLLILPDTAGAAAYNWGYSGGTDIVQHLFATSQISGTPRLYSGAFPSTFRLTSMFYEVFHQGRNESLYKIPRLLNIDKILLRNDINTKSYLGQRTPKESKKAVDFLSTHIAYEKTFGKLDFYKISDEYFLPHIYARPG